jgi:hypothetical protein
MENQNANQSNALSGDLANLKKMFSDYQKKQSQKKRKSSEEILAKYFVPRKTKETFRILPPLPGRKYIEEAFFHVVTTNAAGGKKKHGTVIYCPAHNDAKIKKLDPKTGEPILDGNGHPMMVAAPCPLCDKSKKLLAKQDPSLKGIKKESMTAAQIKINESNKAIFAEANKWEAKKFYIIRGIDKGAEKDGVKFWRFKHNFKNQGTLDKLIPVLDGYVNAYQADYTSPVKGTDFSLTMADSEFNGHVYKTLSAVIFGAPSLLHNDPTVAQQWLEDDITWRDVFLPKKAPNITPLEYLEMVVMGTNPYWDDTDSNNKKWVFPGRPDLEEAANTRTRNLDNDEDEDFEQASDLDEEYPNITINNITQSNVGTYVEDAKDITAKSSILPQTNDVAINDSEISNANDFDDLPF